MSTEDRKVINEPIVLNSRRLLEKSVQWSGEGVLAQRGILVSMKVE